MLVEISKQSIYLSKFEEPILSWQNSVLSVRCIKKLICFEFAHDINSFEKNVSVVESNIICSNESPISAKYLKNYAKQGIKNVELTGMIVDPALWPHNDVVMQEMNKIISFEWSPPDIIFNHLNLLAIVNSCGNVDIFYSKRTHAMNFSKVVKNYLKLPETSRVPKDLNVVRNIAYSLFTNAICWAPQLNQDNSCFFVTCQKSDQILFWKIKCNNAEIQTDFCGNFQSTISEVNSMLWIFKDDHFVLICANTLGQIIAYDCNSKNDTISLNREVMIWEHKDKMVARHMHSINYEDKILFICSKNRHILIQLLDNDLKLISQYVRNVNDYKITCIAKRNNDLYVGTRNASIFKVNYNLLNNCINVNLESIKLKEAYLTYELYGLGISHNGAIFVTALVDRKVRCRKGDLKIDIVFFNFENSYEYETKEILNNPSSQLTDSWDLLEVIRHKIYKVKTMPDINYEKLFLEGDTNIYKMKVYLAFITFYNNLVISKTVKITSKLPELSINNIKEKIYALQAANILNSACYEWQFDKLNSDFKLECVHGAKHMLEYYCKKYKRNIGEFVSDEIFSKSKQTIEYTCQSCDNIIEGFSCKSGHLNVFCSLTFTPIEGNDYLVCNNCKLVARSELVKLKPKCVLCDSYLYFCESIS